MYRMLTDLPRDPYILVVLIGFVIAFVKMDNLFSIGSLWHVM